MTTTPGRGPRGCSMLAGAPECRCPDEAPLLDAAALELRARAMFLWQQKQPPARRAAARRGLDGLLAHARGRGPSELVVELLRLCLLQRLLEERPEDAGETAALLDAFTERAELDGGADRLAEAAVLRAHTIAVHDQDDTALPDAAAALAILADVTGPPPGRDPAHWSSRIARTLNGLLIVLLRLGAHELADEVSTRAITMAGGALDPVARLVHQLNRVRLQLSWALRLERGGREAAAAARFVSAAQIAHTGARLWNEARDSGVAAALPPVEDCTVIGAAYALHRPGPAHLPRLAALSRLAVLRDDRIVLAIAAARCHLAADRTADALARLEPLRAELHRAGRPPSGPALALHRELARIETAGGAGPAAPAVAGYAAALEEELWALRQARLLALRSHAEHQRLSRAHGAVAAQALQDPLTGLPNRRALDRRLAEELGSPGSHPCAVAMVDLDRFKDVNDARSHAVGDRVLQVVASTLRAALRAPDLVARYGGDEFVVVLPCTPLPVARAALVRAADAVAALPAEEAAGVTMSVGVVRAPLGGDAAAVLAGADAAMYRAKAGGGNTVVIGATPTGDMPAGPADSTGRPRRVMSGVPE